MAELNIFSQLIKWIFCYLWRWISRHIQEVIIGRSCEQNFKVNYTVKYQRKQKKIKRIMWHMILVDLWVPEVGRGHHWTKNNGGYSWGKIRLDLSCKMMMMMISRWRVIIKKRSVGIDWLVNKNVSCYTKW